MLFLRSWLEEYIDISGVTNEAVAQSLTEHSSEVEEIRVVTDYFGGRVVVGKITNLRKHPEADRLNVFDVVINSQGETVQIVSAAPNVRESLLVPVALIGAKLPDLVISERKMRGVTSQGMCCGKSELLLENGYSSGLWELNEAVSDSAIGSSICKMFPDLFPSETVFDVKVLPDRIGVIGNHVGLALELATCLGNNGLLTVKTRRLVDPEFSIKESINKYLSSADSDIAVTIKDSIDYANHFFLFDVNVSSSSVDRMIKKRLFLLEKNVIGGFADISNYLMYDCGQPTHFFSKEKLRQVSGGNTISLEIGHVETDTTFVGLGQLKDTTIDNRIPVLTVGGNKEVIAIPAISGGASTKLDENETGFVLEVASFSGEDVARASFDLGYRSEGCKIWAGGVHPRQSLVLLLHFLELFAGSASVVPLTWYIKDVVEPSFEKAVDRLSLPLERDTVSVDFGYIASRLDGRGVDYWQPIIQEKLANLGTLEHGVLIQHPYFSNLATNEDVLTEVMRQVGFDNLDRQWLQVTTKTDTNYAFRNMYQLKKMLSVRGLDEVITRPFISEEKGLKFKHKDHLLHLLNPYKSYETTIRPSLVPSLLDVVSKNIKQGIKDIAIFEINKVYSLLDNQPQEELALTIVLQQDSPYILTSLLYDIARCAGAKVTAATEKQEVELGQLQEYQLDNGSKAHLIQLNNVTKKSYDLPLNKVFWVLSIGFNTIVSSLEFYKSYYDESEFPSVKRSYSFVVPADIRWESIHQELAFIELPNSRIVIQPVERFSKDGSDMVNISVVFYNYVRTFEANDITSWEQAAFGTLKQAFPQIIQRV